MTLLCPQQWAKQREQEFGLEDGAQFVTKGNYARFEWDRAYHTITVPMDSFSNLPILNTAPTYHRSAELIANAATVNVQPIKLNHDAKTLFAHVAVPAVVVSDDEDSSDEEEESEDQTVQASNASGPRFPFKSETDKETVVPEPVLPKDQEAFQRLHERLGHLSFNTMQQLAQCGAIPSKFKKCRVPVCASCQHTGSKPSVLGERTLPSQVPSAAKPSKHLVIVSRWINSSLQLQASLGKSRDGSRRSNSTSQLSSWIISPT